MGIAYSEEEILVVELLACPTAVHVCAYMPFHNADSSCAYGVPYQAQQQYQVCNQLFSVSH